MLKKSMTPSSNQDSWQSQMRDAITNIDELNQFFNLSLNDSSYKIFIPKSFAQKIKLSGPQTALWKQFIPNSLEDSSLDQKFGMLDPIGDERHKKDGPLVHRYPNRVLFFPTNICPVICRYCFRKNELEDSKDLFKMQYEKSLKYLKDHKEVDEIIFSGGDPFILSDTKIETYLDDFSKIPHIKTIRFHSRTPIIIPSRITSTLINIFKKQKLRIIVAVHANHVSEIDSEVESSLVKLSSAGISLLSQSVLLKNINDSPEDLYQLIQKFLDLDVRPYYLHHPDRVKGAMHFYLTLEAGRKIFSSLKSRLSGWACPQYIIDIPGGEGKTNAYNPETFDFSGQLLNKDGKSISISPALDANIKKNL